MGRMLKQGYERKEDDRHENKERERERASFQEVNLKDWRQTNDKLDEEQTKSEETKTKSDRK